MIYRQNDLRGRVGTETKWCGDEWGSRQRQGFKLQMEVKSCPHADLYRGPRLT